MLVLDVLRRKGTEVVTIAPSARVSELVSLLGSQGIGAAVVSIDGRHLSGIVSERDVVRHLVSGSEVLDTRVEEICTSDVLTASPEESVESLMTLMSARRVRHVPIVTDGELCGLISIGDVVKARLDELVDERTALANYIQGG